MSNVVIRKNAWKEIIELERKAYESAKDRFPNSAEKHLENIKRAERKIELLN